ncbi:starch branching enzyme I, partial [Tanacetum coccineum]
SVVAAVECVERFLFQDHDFLRRWEGKIDNTERFKHNNGVWVDRIPTWIKYAIVDSSKFVVPYEDVYGDPPASEG